MASAADPLTEDYCCAYCLQRLPYMVDPRQLPCSHVFCLSCLKDDFAEISATRCRICSRTHEIADFDTLTTVTTPAITDVIQEEEYNILCDVCTGEKSISVVYCSDCMKNYCQQHHQLHDVYLGPDHNIVPVKRSGPASSTCQEHTEEPLTLACSSCHVTFCTSCDTETGCAQVPEMGQHTLVAVEELAKELRREMNSELEKLSEKITAVCKMEKSVWSDFDEAETNVKELMGEVEEDTKAKVVKLQQKSDSVKEGLGQYMVDISKETSSCTTKLMSEKDSLQSVWRSMRSAAQQSDLTLIKRQKESLATLKKAVSSNSAIRAIKHPQVSLLSIGNLSKSPVLVFDSDKPPTCLELQRSLKMNCDICFWSQDEQLVMAKDDEIQIFDKTLTTPNRFRLDKKVMSLIESDEMSHSPEEGQYLAWTYDCGKTINVNGSSSHTNVSINAQLKSYSSSFREHKQIDALSYSHCSYDHHNPITVHSKSFVRKVAINAVKSHILVFYHNKLDVFSLKGDLQYTIALSNMDYPKAIQALPDGNVLILNGERLSKYQYQPPPMPIEFIWHFNCLTSPQGISTDAAGFIYIGVQDGVQVLSPEGAAVKLLIHQLLRSVATCNVCVTQSGAQIAVACGDKTVKVFNTSRQKLQ